MSKQIEVIIEELHDRGELERLPHAADHGQHIRRESSLA